MRVVILDRKSKCWFRIVLLVAFLILSVRQAYSDAFEGMRVFTGNGLKLNSLSIDVIINANKSMMMAFNCRYFARGIQPMISIYLYKDTFIPVTVEKAVVITDVVVYYAPNGSKNMEIGTYYDRFLVGSKDTDRETLYSIDFSDEVNRVLNHFSKTTSNLTAEDVGFYGRFSIQAEFMNSTGVISNKGYLGFPLTFDGNMSDVTLDLTIPENYDLRIAQLGTEDMIRIFPNRVRESISVTSDPEKTTELYMEWKLPEPLPPTPWYDRIPWRYIIPGVSGVFITITVRDVIGRPVLKRLKRMFRRPKSKGERAPKIVFE